MTCTFISEDITFVLGKDIGLPVSIRHAVSNGVLELLEIFDLRNYLHLRSYAMGTDQQSSKLPTCVAISVLPFRPKAIFFVVPL